MENELSQGYLKVQAQSGDGAFPVPDAVVLVFDSDGKSIASLRTDASGLTPTIALTVPSAALSQSPSGDGAALPYATYTVVVQKEGYYSVEDYSVPVFDRITSVQRVNMIPKTEFSPLLVDGQITRVDTPGYENLRGGGEL